MSIWGQFLTSANKHHSQLLIMDSWLSKSFRLAVSLYSSFALVKIMAVYSDYHHFSILSFTVQLTHASFHQTPCRCHFHYLWTLLQKSYFFSVTFLHVVQFVHAQVKMVISALLLTPKLHLNKTSYFPVSSSHDKLQSCLDNYYVLLLPQLLDERTKMIAISSQHDCLLHTMGTTQWCHFLHILIWSPVVQ